MRQQEKESLLCSLYDASFHYGVNALRHEMSTQSRDVKKRSRDKLLHAIRGMDIDDDDEDPYGMLDAPFGYDGIPWEDDNG